jgi:SAM-dependent methyltransferase
MHDDIILQVNRYYTQKVEEFGTTPQGVDWNSLASQHIRFDVLSTLIKNTQSFNLLDYGCGYGAMFDYLKIQHPNFNYTGYDISESMIMVAKAMHASDKRAQWTSTIAPDQQFDFTIAGGIFNIKFEANNEAWLVYVLDTLHRINDISQRGFAFNVLTQYSDQELMKAHLYYADPLFLFDYCKKHFSGQVALLHDYNLYEFTIRVLK